MQCPDCQGDGFRAAFVDRAGGRGSLEHVACERCGGAGVVPQWHAAAIARGEAMRQDRLRRGMTLRREAARLGITAEELSRRERGLMEEAPC